MIGRSILHYRIIEKLGEGGMGVVYKAEDTKLKRTVAIKFLPQRIAVNEDERKRFEVEAQAAAALNHPNIATIYAIEEAEGEVFIAMEYIDGKELHDVIKSDIPDPQSAIDYATQIAEGLQAAHEKNIVHRDVKSTNIMMTEKGHIKIMDFGLAKMQGSQLTQAGTALGTIAYMSPEQSTGGSANRKSDIWAFGVVLYELLTGKLPFQAEYDQAVIFRILSDEPEPIANFRDDVPAFLENVVEKALKKDPEERYQSMAEVLADLKAEEVVDDSALTSKQFEAPESGKDVLEAASDPSPEKTKEIETAATVGMKRKWAYAIAAILAVVAAGIAISSFFSNRTAEIETLAVLPFVNQSSDPEMQYLSDGIPETLIFQLSQLPDLKIRSLSSVLRYQNELPDIQKLGKDLNVPAVLTGRVSVRNDRLAVVVELVDTEQNNTIWGNRYNRKLDDLLEIQRNIAEDILGQLRAELSGDDYQKVGKQQTANSEAYQAYLKGHYFKLRRSEENFRKAIRYFQQAIDLDPNYALAHAGIADSYILMVVYRIYSWEEAIQKIKDNIRMALEIDDNLAEAHAALAHIYMNKEWRFDLAESEYRRALELDPNNADTYHYFSYLLLCTNRVPEGITQSARALALEPLSPVMNRGLGLAYFYARDYQSVIKYNDICLELNPGSSSAYINLLLTYSILDQKEKAIAMLENYLTVINNKAMAAVVRERYEQAGYIAAIHEVINTNEKLGMISSSFYKAALLALIGENEKSLGTLEDAVANNAPLLNLLNGHPAFDGLASNPRFVALLDEIFGTDKSGM